LVDGYVLDLHLYSRGKQSLSFDWSDWRFWVFIVVFAALYFAFASWNAKNRRRTLAQAIGFRWLDTMPETPRGMTFLQSGLGGEFSNAMSGSRAGWCAPAARALPSRNFVY
jgi:hypothetical protein